MTKFLNIRGVEDSVAAEFSAGAAIRGITQAEYLARLIRLRGAAFHRIGSRDLDRIDLNDPAAVARLLESVRELQNLIIELELGDHWA